MKKYIVEALGLMFYMIIGCGSALFIGATNSLASAIVFGLTMAVLFIILSKHSGCHLNPVISFSKMLNKEITKRDFWFYTLFQFIGAILGGLFVFILYTQSPILKDNLNNILVEYSNGEFLNSSMSCVIIIEILITTLYVFIFLFSTNSNYSTVKKAIIIGTSIIFFTVVFKNLSGAGFNPAREFATAFWNLIFKNNLSNFLQLSVYFVSAFIGAFFGYILFKGFKK